MTNKQNLAATNKKHLATTNERKSPSTQITPDRWELIAEKMERPPWEVTKLAGPIKGTCYQVRKT